MGVKKPYHRNYRSHIEGANSGYSNWAFIVDQEYSKFPEHYLRAFFIIQDDFKKILEYIEPADENMETYSYRIHELFMRICIEIEANWKAILKENIYSKKEKDWNIRDYKKVNKTHHLSSYKIIVPIWNGKNNYFQPFIDREKKDSLSRYTAYNKSKHDRQGNFKQANFKNLMEAISGLLIILSSQFRTEDFSPSTTGLAVNTDNYYEGMGSPAIGKFFRIEFPNDWKDDEKYEFNWSELKDSTDKFEKINYNNI